MLAVIVKFDGFLQIACRPVIGNALHHIPIACTNIFDLIYQYKIVRPIKCLIGRGKLYSSNCEISDFAIRETVPFTIVSF